MNENTFDPTTAWQIARRIWQRDNSLWSSLPETQQIIANRLGWLDAVDWSLGHCHSLEEFSDVTRTLEFTHAVLLGMGGSSLAPETIRQIFGVSPGYLALTVIDTTAPDTIRAVEQAIPLDKTLFLVSSKSGTTTETLSLYHYFFDKLSRPGANSGNQFVAITDGGSPLEILAREHNFRHVFTNPSDIGGRYSALSYFGLVPAALLGVDLQSLLRSAAATADSTRPERPFAANAALQFGLQLADFVEQGRDKLTLLLSPELAPLGAWIEQLVAESTGKQGRGIIPTHGETIPPADVSRPDQFIVSITLGGSDSVLSSELERARGQGCPVLEWSLPERADLGGEFFRWEFATAVAAARMGINPFDEPDVADAKRATQAVLRSVTQRSPGAETSILASDDTLQWIGSHKYASSGAGSKGPIDQLLNSVRPGDYLAILAYLPPSPAVDDQLGEIRRLLAQRLNVATCLAYGPRYLHSSGQLHKGGPDSGVYLMITSEPGQDLTVPGQGYSFQQLIIAQSSGDFDVLTGRGRRVLRVHLRTTAEPGLAELIALL